MKKLLAFLLACCLLLPVMAALAEEEDPLSKFAIRSGRRSDHRVAITVDDAFDLAFVWKIRDLFDELGVVGTFFPIGKMLSEEDRAEWIKLLDNGNEIGSHNMGHYRMGDSNPWDIISALGRFQEQLDRTLGFHYQVQSFRPPYGNISDANGKTNKFRGAVQTFGYQHVILWDVSQTEAKKAIHQVQNGSILLYHSRLKDYQCLQELIPQLLDQGYQLVTVSDLLGFGDNETGDVLYTYHREDYEKK